jgi:hypothetical protein
MCFSTRLTGQALDGHLAGDAHGASSVRLRQAGTSTSTSPIAPANCRVVVALCVSKFNRNFESRDDSR